MLTLHMQLVLLLKLKFGQIFKFKFSQIFKDEKMKFSHNREAGTW